MSYVPAAGFGMLGGAAVWVAAILLGWRLSRRSSSREGCAPEPFNWRLLVNPGLYYEWVSAGRMSESICPRDGA